jgi:TRAP-type C4-dicarboxylate transport system substrate-binding protein
MKRLLALVLSAILCAVASHDALAQERLRISLETNPNHQRNRNVERFVAELQARAGERIRAEIFPSAQLYRDRDLPRALRQGSVEMGIPGPWHIDGIVPDTAITALPMFYGVEPDVVYRLVDGRFGQTLNRHMEERLRVKVLGRYFDLGYNHFYGVGRPITRYEDLAGLKIRSPGGSANAARIRILGGNAVLIPWPDLPLAMNQRVIDGLITTHESAYTAKLWDAGMTSAFEDRQYFAQYIPMVSQQFWNRLSPELRQAMTDAWEAVVDGQRREAAEAQAKAREVLIANRVQITEPPAEAIAAARRRLMAAQEEIIADMKLDRGLVEVAAEELRAAGVRF